MRVGERVLFYQQRADIYHMDEAPIPDYVDYFKELKRCGLEHKINPPILFESSRGCWWGEKAHCTFCGLNGQTMKYRAKSADKIERELMTQSRRYKVFTLEAVDNILDMESFKELLPRLADRGFDWAFFYEVKSSLNRNQVDLLKAAGVACIQPGIESLSTEVLKLMRKGVTAIQNIQLLKWGRENKIFIAWNLLYGFPGEKKEYYDEMLEIIPSITHLQPPTVVPRIVLERFSPYHFDAERLGIRNIKPVRMYRLIYPESKVNLYDIAYFFEYTLDESAEDPKKYIKPVGKAVTAWKSAYFKTAINFQYRKGPGFIELQDNRPMKAEGVGPMRKSLLTGIESDVYLLCDSIKSFREINDFVKLRTSPSWSDDQVRQMLEGFVEKRLMIEEKGRYLALATAARQKKKARVGISRHAIAQASKAVGARTLKVLEVVAGTNQCCSDQIEGAVNLIQPTEIDYTRQSL
jgi:ribosomal peptide maturation radical SAM protein 1